MALLRLIVVFLFPFLLFGQNPGPVVQAPGNWSTERLTFPLAFAPEIDFEGIEDVCFAPGWSDPESEEFWTYHFSWWIEKEKALTAELLKDLMNLYYDGLTRMVLAESDRPELAGEIESTLCTFKKSERGFQGKIELFDSFFTHEHIVLYAEVTEKSCVDGNRQLISFNLSPKSPDHPIWEIFNELIITINCD